MDHASAIAEIRAAMARLEPEPEHTRHVAFLALRLFDDLAALHCLGNDERVLLEGAACLHDIGWVVAEGGRSHHKHSARLIRRQAWTHLDPTEVEVMALVARYHRRALPCPEHGDFHLLDHRWQGAVGYLAALLRLADAFDRSHLQFVQDLSAVADERHIEIRLFSRREPFREIAGATKKGNLAREVFQRELVFRSEPVPQPTQPAG